MKTQLDQTAYWNEVAKKKTFSHEIRWKAIETYLSPESKILDFGCGYGRTCDALHQRGYTKVLGVDSAKAMVKRGKSNFPHLTLKHVNEFPLPYKDNTYDAVFLFAVLTCIPLGEDQGKLIRELKRIIKPGGVLYLSDLLINQDERNRKRYQHFMQKYRSYGVFELPEGGIFRHHAASYLKAMFNQYTIAWQENMTVTTMNGNDSQCIQMIAVND